MIRPNRPFDVPRDFPFSRKFTTAWSTAIQTRPSQEPYFPRKCMLASSSLRNQISRAMGYSVSSSM